MSNKFDSERGTPSPPLNFFKYLLVNLILQIEVLCPYKLHDEAFLKLNFWPVRQEHTYAVWTLNDAGIFLYV